VLTPRGRQWIEDTLWHMIGQRNDQRLRYGAEPIEADSRIVLVVRLYGQWSDKNGGWKRRDLSNAIKCLEDCAAKSLGFDDRQVFELHAQKIPCDAERCELDVRILGESDGK
jgi:Holliday junction resolvase RusA-like endonuclease